MTRRAQLPLPGACALVLAACAGDTPARPVPARHERWGIFRDLVLVARNDAKGGPYFLDRFEVSRRDFGQWLAVTQRRPPAGWVADDGDAVAEDDPASLRPATRVDLDTARAYAGWRWCRLPTRSEWEYAASAGGAYRYPWGDYVRAEWANTSDLGLRQPAAIGTFESGRSPDGPYDLVGNVAEWSESLSPSGWRDLVASPVLFAERSWLPRGQPASSFALLAAAPRPLPRQVVGGAYVGLGDAVGRRILRAGSIPTLSCMPDEWSDTIGVRLAADPRSLLTSLMHEREVPSEGAAALLRTFLAEPAHRAALAPEFAAAVERVGTPGPLFVLLDAALRR
ncbi:MAG: SUMF1/EgtB/PvdO family nonheme iron enzyme [Planctomycetota bacterium]